MKYKIGDIIGFTDYESTCLCKVTDVQKLDWAEDVDSYLNIEIIYKNFSKVSLTHTVMLPRDEHKLLTKEEYFEEMQKYINEQQDMLNLIKEKYNV